MNLYPSPNHLDWTPTGNLGRAIALERLVHIQMDTLHEEDPIAEATDEAFLKYHDALTDTEKELFDLVRQGIEDSHADRRKRRELEVQRRAVRCIEDVFLKALYNPHTPLGHKKANALYDENF